MASESGSNATARQPEVTRELEAAVAHHKAGRLDQAEAGYRSVLAKAPNHPATLNLLGVIAIARQQPQLAVELIGKAVEALPGFADAHLNLGNALRLARRSEEAVESYRRALALKPGWALAHSNFARLLNDLGRCDEAATHGYAATGIEPNLLPAWINLAVALKGLRRFEESAGAWRKAVAIDPRRAESHHELAMVLAESEKIDEALAAHDRAIALQPENAAFHCARGSTLWRRDDPIAAEPSFRRTTELAPRVAAGWLGLGWALRLTGRFDEANACFERVREIEPDNPGVFHPLSSGGAASSDERVAELAGRLAAATSPLERITTGFALGKLLDEMERYDDAFARYADANALVRDTWSKGDRFNPAAIVRRVDLLVETYTPDYFAALGDDGNPSEVPVFVVGMPRSGTTLVEQICASHSKMFGAGELPDVDRLAVEVAGGRGHVAEAREGDFDHARRLADAYLRRLVDLGGGAARVIDKMPDNIMDVGLIATLFPRARFIYCSRDPRDISLSCYFQHFGEGMQHFSYDLADCGRRCREVERLAAHWLRVLSDRMTEMNYETLVSDLEGESRRLIAFLGLDWEPACLEFHRTDRAVMTASHWQVRQPLYTRSVNRWRHYERHLGPLLDALGMAAPSPDGRPS